MADTPWQRTAEARRPHWHKGPTGWVVAGAHETLARHLAAGTPVPVWTERRNATVEVDIEHVTEPDRYGLAFAWVKGTRSELKEPEVLDPAPRREQTPVVRKRTSSKTARHKVRRRQRGGH